MKRILTITLIFLTAAVSLTAQERHKSIETPQDIHPGMKFSEYKKLYNVKDYQPRSTDPYSRAAAGITSFCLPGLGQCVNGEIGRGAVILGSSALLTLGAVSQIRTRETENGDLRTYYGSLFIPFLLTDITLWVWNILDAVWVAKIKNMYDQDIRSMQTQTDFTIEPYFAYLPYRGKSTIKPVAGLSVRLKF